MEKGFSSEKYILAQRKKVLERINRFDRLYLEFGGKLCYDGHASRVLPGYRKTLKIEFLRSLKNLELIYCINAKDISSEKRLGDHNFTYKQQTLYDFKCFKKYKISSENVVISRYEREKEARDFSKILENIGKKVYFHKETKNYLQSAKNAIKGLSNQEYVPVKKRIVVVTGPAGGSGKMAVALAQIFHEFQKGLKPGFAKFETFPIWNLSLGNPLNLAYEAATADLQDKIMIDPYHLKAYGIKAVNYNRDIKNFLILREISRKITNEKNPFGYRSPTDMGINMLKEGIINGEICQQAAIKEIRRRHKIYSKEFSKKRESKKTLERIKQIIAKLNNSEDLKDRKFYKI